MWCSSTLRGPVLQVLLSVGFKIDIFLDSHFSPTTASEERHLSNTMRMEMWNSSQCFGLLWSPGQMDSCIGFVNAITLLLNLLSSKFFLFWKFCYFDIYCIHFFSNRAHANWYFRRGLAHHRRYCGTARRARLRCLLSARHLMSVWRGAALIADDTAIMDSGMRAAVITSREIEKKSTVCMNGLNCFL